jgi:hypothetical protein
MMEDTSEELEAKLHAAHLKESYPLMPHDYWPSAGITIAATHGGGEIGFRVTAEELKDGLVSQTFSARLNALRHALWVAENWTNDHLRVADLRSTS